MILPDCVVIAITQDGDAIPLMLAEQDDIRAVVMPISPNKLLMGVIDGYVISSNFNYNLEAARSSDKFFLSSSNDAETARLHSVISESSITAMKATIERKIEEYIFGESARHSTTDAEQTAKPIAFAKPSLSELEYEISFFGLDDKEAKGIIERRLRHVISELSDEFSLKRLDGITVAGDFSAALRDVDRGYEGATPIETVSEEVGSSIAKLVTVLRLGEVKGHVVIDGKIGYFLLLEDTSESEFGLHVVAMQLAQIAMIEFVETTLPGTMSKPIEDELDDWFYKHVSEALHIYVAGRFSAAYGDSQEIFKANAYYLTQGLIHMSRTVSEELLAYYQDGDLDKLFFVTLPCIRDVLKLAACYLGHRAHFRSLDPMSSEELQNILISTSLANWLEMYGSDLDSSTGDFADGSLLRSFLL